MRFIDEDLVGSEENTNRKTLIVILKDPIQLPMECIGYNYASIYNVIPSSETYLQWFE